jgi:hypothetical protein
MPIQTLEQLRDAVAGFLVTDGGRTLFAMPPDGLGSASVAALISASFGLTDGRWVLDAPTQPVIRDGEVVLSGQTGSLLGVAPARLDLAFDLADGGAPALVVGLAPLDGQPHPDPTWNLGKAFPVWVELRSSLPRLRFDAPAFWYSSIARAAGGGRPALTTGLTFGAAALRLEGILQLLAGFTGARFADLAGAVTGPATAPHLVLASAPTQAVPIQYLDLPLTFSAVSADPGTWGKIRVPPPAVDTWLQLASTVRPGGSIPPIPVEVRFDGVGPVVVFRADLREASSYALGEFSHFVHDAPLGTYLGEYFDIGSIVQLTDLRVMVGTEPLSLEAVSLGLGTKRPLTVVEHWVEIPDVHVTFMVNDPAGTRDLTAVLAGTFVFMEDLTVDVNAVFPQMLFSGGLRTDPPVPLERIVRKFVPSVQSFPDIRLNELFVSADLKNRRYAFQLAVTSGWRIPIGIAEFQMKQASLALEYASGAGGGFTGEVAATAVLFDGAGTEVAEFFADWKLPGDFLIRGTFPEIPLSRLATTLTGGAVPDSAGLPEITLRDSVVEFHLVAGSGRLARMGMGGETGYRFSLSTTVEAAGIGQAGLFFEVRRGTAAAGGGGGALPGHRPAALHAGNGNGAGRPLPAATAEAAARRAAALAVVHHPEALADGDTGFAAGLVLQPAWKPDAVWSGLKPVFDVVTVRDAGLILSSIEDDRFSLPNLRMDYVPQTIKPGVTFFAALLLTGDVFGPLRQLFGANVELDLYAHINPSSLADSEIVARLPGESGKKAVLFTGLTVELKLSGEFTITAGARFTVSGEQLTLEGAGTLRLEPPAATFVIRVANWVEPFGIRGLTVLAFGLSFGVDEVGVTIGLLGSFMIGSDPEDRFKFLVGGQVVDFEAPSAFTFALESGSGRPLKVTDLVRQFTSLDLGSVPLLGGLAFVKLDFYVVADPAGWMAPDGHFYPAGIGVDADLLLYEWELKLFMVVAWSKGILADGSLSRPIDVLGLLVISSADGTKGPSAHIDTTGLVPGAAPLPTRLNEQLARTIMLLPHGATHAARGINPYTVMTAGDQEKVYFAFSGAVKLLGLSESFSGSVTRSGFEVNFHAELAHLFRAAFCASFSTSAGFKGRAEGRFDFSLELPNGFSIDGWQVIPPVVVKGPNAFLGIDCAVGAGEAYVGLALRFSWGSIGIDVSFRLDARQIPALLASLWEHVKEWILAHLRDFFAPLLNDVRKWVDAVVSGFLWAGQTALQIAQVLYHVFSLTGIEALAAELVKFTRLGFEEMVRALMAIFDVSFSAAVRVLESLGEVCAMATNELFLTAGDDARP